MHSSRDTTKVKEFQSQKCENFLADSKIIEKTKFRISWKNLTVRIDENNTSTYVEKVKKMCGIEDPKNRRFIEILKSASGCAEAGNTIGVMGPSGAGKTTLLDALAKRLQPSSGSIRINGVEVTNEIYSKISSYVPQCDSMPATLTASEYIAFSCALRLDGSTSPREREIAARQLIANMGLDECKDSLIDVLSGGERKRLSVAAEMITMPRLLFLDEPTTGLDTSAALRVVESFKPVSTNGIVVCSIHQPSVMIYKLFSHVLFLTDGRTAFFGSLEDARIFFQREGFRCPIGFDEAEYYVKILSSRIIENFEYSNETTSLDTEDRCTRICRAYASSEFSKIPEPCDSTGTLEIGQSNEGPRWIVQLNWLLWRHYLDNRRTIVNGLIAFQYYAMSIIMISMFFWNIDTHEQRGVRDVMGVLYVASSETIFSTAYTPIYEIQREIMIYQRESSMYGPAAYHMAVFINWMPKAVLKASVLSVMLLIILGSATTSFCTFFKFFACTAAGGICACAYGTMIASFIDDNEIATAIMVPLDLIAMLMAGVYYSLGTLKWYMAVFKYVSIFYYVNEALAIAHWSQIHVIECETDETLPCISSGGQVLMEYGYEESNFWTDIMAMGILTIVMNFVGYLGTRRRRLVTSFYRFVE